MSNSSGASTGSSIAPRTDKYLKEFEKQLQRLVKEVKHKERKDIQSDFLKELDKKVKDIKKSKNVFVAADKSSNYYEMSKEHHSELLLKAINKDYKKAPYGKVDEVNREAKVITDKLEISDKIFKLEPKQSVITVKDHKEDYMNHTQTRLINPTKSHLGKVSKVKLEELNRKIRAKANLTQWRNTDSTIKWFKDLDNKGSLSFLQFDIDSYYPSITAELLDKAHNWASELVPITKDDRELYHQVKNSILFDRGTPWVKKGETSFDITMGSYDGAESTDIVGLFLLSQLKHLPANIGLYRDDGLGVSTLKPKENEALKKQISDIFKANGLSITIVVNKKVISFLNVTLNLINSTYRDFSKPNHVPLYVHKESNHPPAVTKCIASGVNQRLSANSSSKDLFNAAKGLYQEQLLRAGHKEELKFKPKLDEEGGRRRRRRKRDICWFNPPFCRSVTTNVGQRFLQILDVCFPVGHPCHKALNRATVKVSYRTLPSLGSIIANHNSKIIGKGEVAEEQKKCSCPEKDKPTCPLNGECLATNIIYQAKVKALPPKRAQLEDEVVDPRFEKVQTYLGRTKPTWKSRSYNHTASFDHISKRKHSGLSQYIWDLKEKGWRYKISWALIKRSSSFSPSTDTCRLCLEEKHLLMMNPDLGTLNVEDEFYASCRHRGPLLLSKFL